MERTVYLETSIVSYLAALPSRDLIVAAHLGLPLLEVNAPAAVLARDLVQTVPLPPRAGADALHIAVAAVHGMGYLAPVLCTPDELMGGELND